MWNTQNSVAGIESLGGGVAITSGASNTKGAYAELSSSTSFNTKKIVITADYMANWAVDHLYDISIGAAGSEVVKIPNLLITCCDHSQYQFAPFVFPVEIPAGSRISARAQNSSSSDRTVYLSLILYGGLSIGDTLSVIDVYGVNTADSGGTQLDPGGTAWTWSAYVELTASTIRNHRGFIIAFGNQINTFRDSAASWAVEIAHGTAGNEQTLTFSKTSAGNLNSGLLNIFSEYIPIQIPIGTRIAARVMSSSTPSSRRKIDVALYCFS